MGNTASDRKNARCFSLKFSRNTDREIIEHLESQPSIQAYIKRLIKTDMRGANNMKTYIIKPDFLDKFGPDANAMTVLDENEIDALAAEWEIDADELKTELIEIEPSGYRAIHRFAGKPGWQELNELIRQDSGCEEDYCETEADYKQAVRDGFIKYDGHYTTIYVDD